jgi:hypothetical protein
MITHVMGLEEINTAFDLMHAGKSIRSVVSIACQPDHMEAISISRSHGGTQGVYRHASSATGTGMTFAVFVPDHTAGAKLPVLWYLSGLTCTHANVMEKGEFRAACTRHGIIFVAPDTSPARRGCSGRSRRRL